MPECAKTPTVQPEKTLPQKREREDEHESTGEAAKSLEEPSETPLRAVSKDDEDVIDLTKMAPRERKFIIDAVETVDTDSESECDSGGFLLDDDIESVDDSDDEDWIDSDDDEDDEKPLKKRAKLAKPVEANDNKDDESDLEIISVNGVATSIKY